MMKWLLHVATITSMQEKKKIIRVSQARQVVGFMIDPAEKDRMNQLVVHEKIKNKKEGVSVWCVCGGNESINRCLGTCTCTVQRNGNT